MSKIRWFTDQADVEQDAVMQVERTASMPFVRGLAVMPDVHYGKGSTVGTVVATKGAVMPACVGVDIGCGMIAFRTGYRLDAVRRNLAAIRESIERRIPLGIGPFGQNSCILQPHVRPRVDELETMAFLALFKDRMDRRHAHWRQQLGSLGGGNHFIEVCVGHPVEEGFIGPSATAEPAVWVILHSGSRGIGNKTGAYWTNVAKEQAKHYLYDSYLPDPDLAYLVEGTEAYEEYLKEVKWCQRYAALNREIMLERVLEAISRAVGPEGCEEVSSVEWINCHHNYVNMENHDGENVLVTRKGAILAADGVRGLIPGSMGARSFVVEGLGHPGAYRSAPHGAGRRMSRTKARQQFTVESVAAEMAAQGIEARVRGAIVDEAPGAYKDIDAVMHDARVLVRPTWVLSQLVSVKGD